MPRPRQRPPKAVLTRRWTRTCRASGASVVTVPRDAKIFTSLPRSGTVRAGPTARRDRRRPRPVPHTRSPDLPGRRSSIDPPIRQGHSTYGMPLVLGGLVPSVSPESQAGQALPHGPRTCCATMIRSPARPRIRNPPPRSDIRATATPIPARQHRSRSKVARRRDLRRYLRIRVRGQCRRRGWLYRHRHGRKPSIRAGGRSPR
jgi:hypothetical protein